MENISVTGEVVRVLETKETGANNYKLRSVHVKTIEQHAQFWIFNLLKEMSRC